MYGHSVAFLCQRDHRPQPDIMLSLDPIWRSLIFIETLSALHGERARAPSCKRGILITSSREIKQTDMIPGFARRPLETHQPCGTSVSTWSSPETCVFKTCAFSFVCLRLLSHLLLQPAGRRAAIEERNIERSTPWHSRKSYLELDDLGVSRLASFLVKGDWWGNGGSSG